MDRRTRLRRLREQMRHDHLFLEGRYQHVRDRIAERYNHDLTHDEYEDMCLDIFLEQNGVEWVDQGTDAGSSLFALRFRGQMMLVAYSEAAYVVMTVLPKDDYRLRHHLSGTYIRRALTDQDTIARDDRRRLAEQLDDLVDNGAGVLVKPRPVLSLRQEIKSPSSPFADALKGVKLSQPVPPRVQTPAPAVADAAPAPPPPDDPGTLAMFARAEAELDRLEREAGEDEQQRQTRIAELEARIAAIRAEAPAKRIRARLLQHYRVALTEALDEFRAGHLPADQVADVILCAMPAPSAAAGSSPAS